MYNAISGYWQEVQHALGSAQVEAARRIADELLDCYQRNGTVFVAGNGGSAATASHFACDLAKGTRGDGPPTFKVACPTDSIPLLTAWANDVDYAEALAAYLEPLIRERDVLIAISTSGTSTNVLRAADRARAAGATTIALTGPATSALARKSAITLAVPSGSIEQIEDVHSIVAHSICVALRERIQQEALGRELVESASEPYAHRILHDAVSLGNGK